VSHQPDPILTGLTVGDDPAAWRAAGFTLEDSGRCRVGRVDITLTGHDDGRGIRGWSFAGLALGGDDLDGLATTSSPPTSDPDAGAHAAPTHPNGVTAIDHVVVLTPDRDRTLATFAAAGLEARRSRQADTYGAPMIQTFFRAGEVVLELIGAPEPLGDGPCGFFGVAYRCADLDQTAAALGDHLGRVSDAVQPGRRIATLRHEELGLSVATAFMSR
jgi:hypothetical protein